MTEHERYIQSLKKRSYYYSYGIGGGFAAAGLTLVCFGHFAPGASIARGRAYRLCNWLDIQMRYLRHLTCGLSVAELPGSKRAVRIDPEKEKADNSFAKLAAVFHDTKWRCASCGSPTPGKHHKGCLRPKAG